MPTVNTKGKQMTTQSAPGARTHHQKEPVERALMLIALGLDPRFTYTNYELQNAWRRRLAQIHPDASGNGVTAAAINASYLTLIQQGEVATVSTSRAHQSRT
jgi:hypothetical protein